MLYVGLYWLFYMLLQIALFHSVLWWSNITLYLCTTSLPIHLSMDILSFFHVLPIVNSAVMNIAWIFLNYGFLQIYVQVWDCWIKSWLYFQLSNEPPSCSPWWLYQFTFPPRVWEGSLFSMTSSAFIICTIFDDGYSHHHWLMWGDSSLEFWFAFP